MFKPALVDTATMWKKLNSLLKRNIPQDTTQTIQRNGIELSGKPLADAFNRYFIDVVRSVNVQNDLENFRYIDNSIILDPVSYREVIDAVLGLNNSSALDIDDIQVKPLKYVICFLTSYIAHIFNLSISQGVFPSKMQTARVTVLHKKGDKNDMGNYRPVSILPVLSKSLEKLFLKPLTRFGQKQKT